MRTATLSGRPARTVRTRFGRTREALDTIYDQLFTQAADAGLSENLARIRAATPRQEKAGTLRASIAAERENVARGSARLREEAKRAAADISRRSALYTPRRDALNAAEDRYEMELAPDEAPEPERDPEVRRARSDCAATLRDISGARRAWRRSRRELVSEINSRALRIESLRLELARVEAESEIGTSELGQKLLTADLLDKLDTPPATRERIRELTATLDDLRAQLDRIAARTARRRRALRAVVLVAAVYATILAGFAGIAWRVYCNLRTYGRLARPSAGIETVKDAGEKAAGEAEKTEAQREAERALEETEGLIVD